MEKTRMWNHKRRRMAIVLVLLILVPSIASCEQTHKSEPEQVFLVSAVGFDADGEQIRLTLELPVISSDGEMEKPKVISASGGSVDAALGEITSRLGKELLFSHCALMALGEELSRERLEETFGFVEAGTYLPLACEVVATKNAEALLKSNRLSSVAAGYEITEIYKRERGLLGLDFQSEIYAICSSENPERQILLPWFEPSEGEEDAPRFCGLRILRADAPTVTVNREECVAYAVLSDHFDGGNDSAGQMLGVSLERVSSNLSAELSDGVLYLTVSLSARARENRSAEELRLLETRITEESEALFCRLRETVGDDVFYFFERLKKENDTLRAEIEANGDALLASATLSVRCRIEERGIGVP